MPVFHEGLEALRRKYGPLTGWQWGAVAGLGVGAYFLLFKKGGGGGKSSIVPLAPSVLTTPPNENTNGPGGGGGLPPNSPPIPTPTPPVTQTPPVDTFVNPPPAETSAPHGGPIFFNPHYSDPGSLTGPQKEAVGEYTQYVAKVNELPATNDLDTMSLNALKLQREQFGAGARTSVDHLQNVPIDDAISYLTNKISSGHPPAVGSPGGYGAATATQGASSTGQLVH